MDPATLAATATGLLAPLLAKMGESAMEEVGAKLPEKIGKVWSAIAARFQGNPTASGAANDLAKKADDPENQETFALQLRKVLKEDPAFAEMFAGLLNDAQESITNVGDGAVATGGSNAAGKLEVGGDLSGNVVVGNKNVVGDQNKNMNIS